jgi:lysyl-tRNA synthetase class I
MKFKNDFITNSSSASFILKIKSTANNLKDFIELWNLYIKHYTEEHKYKIDEKVEKHKKWLRKYKREQIKLKKKIENNEATKYEKIKFELCYKENENESDEDIKKDILGNMMFEKISKNLYEVSHWTSMFNCIEEDVPNWMIELIVLYNMDPKKLLRYGFKNIKFEIKDDN